MDEVLESGFKFHVQFHINNTCNLRCKHCYEGEQSQRTLWTLSEFKIAIAKLWDAFHKWDVIGEISLIGGEPTLHPDYFEFVDYLTERGDIDSISILTNGTRINDDFINNTKKNKCHIQVSIDGFDESHHDVIRGIGNYKRVVDGIRRLINSGIYPSVHYVLSKYTTPITDDFLMELVSLGIKQVSFSRLVPFGRAQIDDMLTSVELKDVFDRLSVQKKELSRYGLDITATRPLWCAYGYSGRCPVAIQTITILENGDIMPCRRLPIIIGNIKKDSFYKVWYTSDVLNKLRGRKNLKKCGNCSMLNLCGGARCIAYAVNDDYMSEDPQCWL